MVSYHTNYHSQLCLYVHHPFSTHSLVYYRQIAVIMTLISINSLQSIIATMFNRQSIGYLLPLITLCFLFVCFVRFHHTLFHGLAEACMNPGSFYCCVPSCL